MKIAKGSRLVARGIQKLPATRYQLRATSGFTIVELLVVVSIIAILMGLSIPAYNAFNSKQTVRQTGENLVQSLRDAQNRASSGDSATLCALKPSPAPGTPLNYKFRGWYVYLRSGTTDGKSYSLGGSCESAGAPVSVDTKTNQQVVGGASYISAISTGTPTCILFEPVTLAVRFFDDANCTAEDLTASQADITITQGTDTYQLRITRTGSIHQL